MSAVAAVGYRELAADLVAVSPSPSTADEIAEAVLARMAEGEAVQRVRVTAGRKGDFKYAIK